MSTVKALSARDSLTQRFSAMELWTVEKMSDYGDLSRWQFTCDEHCVEIYFTATGRVREATVFQHTEEYRWLWIRSMYTGTHNKKDIVTAWLEHINRFHVRMEFPTRETLSADLHRIARNTEKRN